MRDLLHTFIGKRGSKWGLAFLFCLVLSPTSVWAWNEEYAYGLPQERRMCVQRQEPDGLTFTSIDADGDCPTGAKRYIVIFGKEPKGAMALIPTATSLRFYPPLTLNWPVKERFSATPLWHFTCLAKTEMSPLGVKLSLPIYRGEITAGARENCIDAEQRALNYCRDEMKGESLLETCPLSWSGQ